MKKERILFGLLVLAVVLTFPMPVLGSDWKIVRMWTNPGCYKVGIENSVRYHFELQATPPSTPPSSPGDLVIKVLYKSNIESFEKKLNLTQAVASTCGPTATTCPVNWDGEVIVVGQAPGYYSVTKDGIIGPKVRGSVMTTIEVYTVDARGTRLTDKKILRVRDCPRPVPPKK